MSHRPRILVTGASRRLGRALAVELARRGCDLLLTSSRGVPSLEETRREVRQADPRVRVDLHALSFGEEGAIEEFVDAIAPDPLDGLVHNASTYEPSDLASLDPARVRRDLEVHAVGPLRLTAALRPRLARSTMPGRPAVVLPLDAHSQGRPRVGWSSYLLSKAAMAGLVEILAAELAPSTRVIGVALGAMLWPEDARSEEIAAYEKRIALGRSGTPREAVEAMAWALLEASFVTGTTIRVDGGRAIR